MEKYPESGDLNLKILRKADNFSNWMFSQIKPFLKGTILELGSGIGTYSKLVIDNFPNNKIILSDIDKKYVNYLKGKFAQSNVSVFKLDITNENDFRNLNCTVDSIFVLNVLEHVEDDVQVLKNCYSILNPGGKLIILVPAHKFLFNCIDKTVGHYRRYTKKEMISKVSKTKFKIKRLFYFNFLSIFGWYWNGSILKKEILNESALGLFNKLVPILSFFEKHILRKKLGMSLVVVLEK